MEGDDPWLCLPPQGIGRPNVSDTPTDYHFWKAVSDRCHNLLNETILITSGQSRRTWTVESHSPGGVNVHPCLIHARLAHPSPQSNRHLDRFSRFLHSSLQTSYILQWPLPLPIKIAALHSGSRPHLYVVPWAHPSPQPERHLDRFSRFCTCSSRQRVPKLYSGPPPSPESWPFAWGIWTPSQTDVDPFSLFCKAEDCDRRYSVCDSRSHPRSTERGL